MRIMTEEVTTKSGLDLLVETRQVDNQFEVSFRTQCKRKCLLHWGLCYQARAAWHLPPRSLWPKGTRVAGHAALETPFLSRNGESRLVIRLDHKLEFPLIDFVLFFPTESRWDNNSGQNYQIKLPQPQSSSHDPMEELRREISGDRISFERVYKIEKDKQLAVAVSKDQNRYHLRLITDLPGPLLLHWGMALRSRQEWLLPHTSMCPPETTVFQDKAAQTVFSDRAGLRRFHMEMSEQEAPLGIVFVIKRTDIGRWFDDHGRNFYTPFVVPEDYEFVLGDLADVADEIITREMSKNSWTLMHRFNLCHDLFDRVRNEVNGLALIFVWLRFSALRQLDWQRNYNTKPKELSHAQDRLTQKLASRYGSEPKEREFIRLILATLGPGGEGQRIRDEILKIMHRHHIKEVSGHFMEEWHQKLHNNATPDDVVICEAYLEFLRSDGNLDLFYERLEAGGVTKERLESYERPIKTHPDFVPHLKEALIYDFEQYLSTLKAVHAGTDLGSAIDAARSIYDAEMHDLMDSIWLHRNDPQIPLYVLVERITEARLRLRSLLEANRSGRDLLYLDLALEDFLRIAVERNIHTHLSGDQLVDLITLVLKNLSLGHDDQELVNCLRQWQRLAEMDHFGKEWSLLAKAVLDRLGRVLSTFIDFYYHLIQPKAEFLGKAFVADPWSITLFTEEVVRGRPAFVLSMLLRHLDPVLRRHAELGNWQVVSPGRGIGQVEVVADLRSIQGRSFAQPTILVVDKVAGDEEIPPEVTAVITPDLTDIVSHVAVRARNANLLFATCYDPEIFHRLKSFAGHLLEISVSAAGDVVFEQDSGEVQATRPPVIPIPAPVSRPTFSAYAITEHDFNQEKVGGKSYNLKRLEGKLPAWIRFPTSVALPFGVFEKVLGEQNNNPIAERYDKLIRRLDEDSEVVKTDVLAELGKTIIALEPPEELFSSLQEVMNEARLPRLQSWEAAWSCIKRVWASTWNERAYLSRKARGIPHGGLYMAVLIQEIIEAEYSFVIHTVNPSTGNREEIYAEVVLGLGETLVGNYPGRALGFSCRKGDYSPEFVAFPSKSVGLFGSGLIFRSDSSGEDLSVYAGAGLYDSVMLPPPAEAILDYTEDRLVWDEDFRKNFLSTITNIGSMIEQALESPQDIEGSYSKGQFYVVQARPQVTSNDD
jgi:alpha-glucan,water dikinase